MKVGVMLSRTASKIEHKKEKNIETVVYIIKIVIFNVAASKIAPVIITISNPPKAVNASVGESMFFMCLSYTFFNIAFFC